MLARPGHVRDQHAHVVADQLRVDVLVQVGVHLDGGRVQPGLVREGRSPHVGLAVVHRDVGDAGDGVADPGCLRQGCGGHQRPAVLQLQVGDDGDEVGVAGALPVAVHCALHVHHAGFDGGEGVGDGAAGVVVAVDAEVDADLGCCGDDVAHPGRQHAAVGVAQDDDLRAGLGGGADDLEGVVGVGAVAVEEVLAVDEHPAAIGDEVAHRVRHHGEVLLQRGVQGAEDVLVMALRDDADHLGGRVQQRLHLRVLRSGGAHLAGGAEGHQFRVLQLQFTTGCGSEEGGVVGVCARPAALDEPESQLVQVARDLQLVADTQLQALLLGTITQGRVEDVEDVGGGGQRCHSGTSVVLRGIIGRVCLPRLLLRLRFTA